LGKFGIDSAPGEEKEGRGALYGVKFRIVTCRVYTVIKEINIYAGRCPNVENERETQQPGLRGYLDVGERTFQCRRETGGPLNSRDA
jgi:hypothetical protein